MTTVVCKMNRCPYWFGEGFCGKPVVAIDENGMCMQLWKHGRQISTALEPIDENLKVRPVIVEGEYYEQSSKEEECGKRQESSESSAGTDDGTREYEQDDCRSDAELEGGNE